VTSHRRILIVEDDADIRASLADAMRASGADVDLAVDGLDAIERLHAGPCPAVVLLDLRLPRLNGQAFLDALRGDARFEHLPVITMTAGSGRAEGDDIVARLSKPIDVDDLRRIVESLFEASA
jgi:two-component system response regulator MprA